MRNMRYHFGALCLDGRGLTYLLPYLLTPWSRVLLEKLTGSAASQDIPRIFGTRKFLTVLTSGMGTSKENNDSINRVKLVHYRVQWQALVKKERIFRIG
jgi:hypothetical protein